MCCVSHWRTCWSRGLRHAGHRAGVHHAAGERFHRLPPEAPGSSPEGSLLEHVLLGGVDSPVVALAGSAQGLGQLDEALIEGQVVTDRVLPALVRPAEEWKLLLKLETKYKSKADGSVLFTCRN